MKKSEWSTMWDSFRVDEKKLWMDFVSQNTGYCLKDVKWTWNEFSCTCVFSDSDYQWCYTSGIRHVTKMVANINVNGLDAVRYAEQNNISVRQALSKLMAHECMHLVLRFFDQDLDMHPKLKNLAQDLEINSLLDIHHPGVVPEDFNLPPYKNYQWYYQMLKMQMDGSSESSEAVSQALSDLGLGENIEVSAETAGSADDAVGSLVDALIESAVGSGFTPNMEEKRMPKASPETIAFEGTAAESCQKLLSVAETAACIASFGRTQISGIREIIREIDRTENRMEAVPTTWKSSYRRPNRRRDSGSIVLPGRVRTAGGLKRRWDRVPVVLVDVSGSTSYVEENGLSTHQHFMSMAKEIRDKTGAVIVYYDTAIRGVVKPGEDFRTAPPGGGTYVKNVVRKYVEQYGEMDQLYVITDGRDHSITDVQLNPELYGVKGEPKFWMVEKGKVVEIRP